MKRREEEKCAIAELKAVRDRETGKVPLRVNSKTIIMVHKHNRNKKYADEYLKKLEERKLNW